MADVFGALDAVSGAVCGRHHCAGVRAVDGDAHSALDRERAPHQQPDAALCGRPPRAGVAHAAPALLLPQKTFLLVI